MSEANEAEGVRGTEVEYINLKVLGQDNKTVTFCTTKCTPLRKLMKAYCDFEGMDMSATKFLLNGQRINPRATPLSLQIQEDDVIEVLERKD
ncbi:hypothetical protein Cfor_05460 [Coptotermes formosanus]|uniref:Ubiquitin-like domain-containing protein n=1 Tax=Coptotermes formosanus TaxID=36987 RepID=A0A6L2Q043_COPFO|nr:hypothetical protein Cfor_05460 [Coptotermes formosanus]